jgi:hypothetical protein
MKETRDRKSRNPEGIETVHLRDRCRKSGASRHIANREIGVPKVKRNRTSEVPKSRHNRDRPSERTRGRRLVPSAKGPTGGRSSANRKSGYRRSRAQRFCAFRNRDPRNPDEWRPAVRDKDAVTGNGHVNQGQPGGLKHIANREIANPTDINIMSS